MSDQSNPADEPIAFAGGVLTERRHVCAFFDSDDDERRVMFPFIADGLARGQKAFHIVDPDLRAEYIDRFQAAGVDMPARQASGQFEIRNWDEAYLRDGHFDQDAMLALIEEVLQAGPERRFPPHTAGSAYGVGARGPPRRGRSRGIRDAAELRPAPL